MSAPNPQDDAVASDVSGSVELLDVDELAAVLRVSRWSLYRWAADGRIPSIRAGRSVRFVVAEVVAALRAKAPAPLAPRTVEVPAPGAPAVRRDPSARGSDGPASAPPPGERARAVEAAVRAARTK